MESPSTIKICIKDVSEDQVEFGFEDLDALIAECDKDPEAPISSSMIIALCVQRMLTANLIQPMAMLVCQDLLTEMRNREIKRQKQGQTQIVTASLDGVINPE